VRRLLVPLSLLLAVPCAVPDVPQEGDGIVASLALAPGMTVADVGAGDGRYSVVLARTVGPAGRVFATEVDASDIDRIAARARDEGLGNLTTVLGKQQDTGLPAACCDAILLRLVYHHFTDTAAMRKSAQGRRHVDGVPDRGGHGIGIAELIADMKRSGFEVVARDEDWPAEDDAYLVVFRRPAG
jgi:SAM-dependent methyltransferase